MGERRRRWLIDNKHLHCSSQTDFIHHLGQLEIFTTDSQASVKMQGVPYWNVHFQNNCWKEKNRWKRLKKPTSLNKLIQDTVVIKWLKSNLSRRQRSRFKHNLMTMIWISIYNKFHSFFQFPYYVQSLFKKAHLDMRHRVPAYTRRVKYRIFSNKICLFVPYGLITKTCRKMNILPFLFYQNEIVQEKFNLCIPRGIV